MAGSYSPVATILSIFSVCSLAWSISKVQADSSALYRTRRSVDFSKWKGSMGSAFTGDAKSMTPL